jgi:hypothetical protein
MAVSGEFSCPSVGNSQWPLTRAATRIELVVPSLGKKGAVGRTFAYWDGPAGQGVIHSSANGHERRRPRDIRGMCDTKAHIMSSYVEGGPMVT